MLHQHHPLDDSCSVMTVRQIFYQETAGMGARLSLISPSTSGMGARFSLIRLLWKARDDMESSQMLAKPDGIEVSHKAEACLTNRDRLRLSVIAEISKHILQT